MKERGVIFMAFFYDRKEDIWQADCGKRVTLVESKED